MIGSVMRPQTSVIYPQTQSWELPALNWSPAPATPKDSRFFHRCNNAFCAKNSGALGWNDVFMMFLHNFITKKTSREFRGKTFYIILPPGKTSSVLRNLLKVYWVARKTKCLKPHSFIPNQVWMSTMSTIMAHAVDVSEIPKHHLTSMKLCK